MLLSFWPAVSIISATNLYILTQHCVSAWQTVSRHSNSLIHTLRLWPSKGSEPVIRVNRMTPRLHASTSGPVYFFPVSTTYQWPKMLHCAPPKKKRSHFYFWNNFVKTEPILIIFGTLNPEGT